jgi:hypothetical protein
VEHKFVEFIERAKELGALDAKIIETNTIRPAPG